MRFDTMVYPMSAQRRRTFKSSVDTPRSLAQSASRNKLKAAIVTAPQSRHPTLSRAHEARFVAAEPATLLVDLTSRALTRPFSKLGPAAKSRAVAPRPPPGPPRSHIYTGPRR